MKKIFAALLLTAFISGCDSNEEPTPSTSVSANQPSKGISQQVAKTSNGNFELKWPTTEVYKRLEKPYQAGERIRALFPDQFSRTIPDMTYAGFSSPGEDQGLYFQHFPTNEQLRVTLTEVDAQLKPVGTPTNVHTVTVDPRSKKDIVHKFPFRLNVIVPNKIDALYTIVTELVKTEGSVSDSIINVLYVPGDFINAELSTDKEVYTPVDTVQLKIDNHGPTSLSFGSMFLLEKEDNGKWVPINGNSSWTMIGYGVMANGEFTQNINLGNLENIGQGKYRISKNVDVDQGFTKFAWGGLVYLYD